MYYILVNKTTSKYITLLETDSDYIMWIELTIIWQNTGEDII